MLAGLNLALRSVGVCISVGRFVPSGITRPTLARDYLQLAKDFRQHSASLVAVGAVYAPIILLIPKFLHLDFIGTIASVFVKKKPAA
jgi:hypothetical protein